MSRPKVFEGRVQTAVRIPEALHERLAVAATERDVSVNQLVCRAIEQFLDRLPPLDEVLGSPVDPAAESR